MIDTQKKTNDLIPILIDKFEDYSKNIKNRIKINSIFSEFDEKTRVQLNEFIKMSHIRCKGVKSGNDLQNILYKQKFAYNDISDKVLNDLFYCTKEIDIENKKLLKRTDGKKSNEINELRKQIKQDTKNYSKHELKVRERLSKQIDKRREIEKSYPNAKSRLAYIYEPKLNFDSQASIRELPSDHEDHPEEDEVNKSISYEEKKQYFDDLINDDKNKFKENIDNYCDYLKEVEHGHENGQVMKLNHKFTFLTEDMKMLAFKEEIPPPVVKKKEDPAIDIIKLMRYTKRGKSARWFTPKTQTISTVSPNSNEMPSTAHSTMYKTISEFKNTRQTVKKEAAKAMTIDENFSKKRDNMNNFFKNSTLPRAEEYEELIRYKSGKASRSHSNNFSPKLLASRPIGYNDQKRNITSSFRRTFGDKTRQWKKEDDETEQKRLNEIENKKEINIFLKKIKHTLRKPQYYIDYYSKNDGVTNQAISQFNKTSGNGLFTQKKIKSKGEILNKKEALLRQFKAQNKKKQEEAEIMKGKIIAEKIRQNVIDDEGEKGEIDLNAEIFATKIEERANQIIVNPYDEFMDFKQKIIEKDAFISISASAKNIQGSQSKMKKYSTEPILNASHGKRISSPMTLDITKKLQSGLMQDSTHFNLNGNSNIKNSHIEIQCSPNDNKDMKFMIKENVKENN